MSDTATDVNGLLARFPDVDDGSGVGGVGWIEPADDRALIRSAARQWATNTAIPTTTGATNEPFTPGGNPTASAGFAGTRGASDFVKVAAGQPSRIGTISVYLAYTTGPAADFKLRLTVGGTTVAEQTVKATTPGSVSVSASSVTFAADAAVQVVTVGENDGLVISAFRLAVEASLAAV